MNSRTIAILIFVLGAVVLAVVAILILTQNGDTETPTPPQDGTAVGENGEQPPEGEGTPSSEEATPAPSLVEVVVSLQTVQRGYQFTEADVLVEGSQIVTTDFRQVGSVPSNVITDPEDIIGLYARTDIFQGETLTRDAFVRDPAVVGDEYGPSSLIPPGYIAMGVPIRDFSEQGRPDLVTVGYSLDEGDYVDIMLTFELYRIDEQFQTYLENAAQFFIEEQIAAEEADGAPASTPDPDADETDEATEPTATLFFIDPFGRLEELPTGDLAIISPSEFQRPVRVGIIIQNARVIQVDPYTLPEPLQVRIPEPTAESELLEGEETATPTVEPTAIPTALPPQVVVVALAPQQQIFLRYAIDAGADISFGLRNANDSTLFAVDNVDFEFLLELFNIEVPPDFDYTLTSPDTEDQGTNGNGSAEPTTAPEPTQPPPEGGGGN